MIRFTDLALRELHDQINWLYDRSPTAARKASGQIRRTLERLADFPELAPLVDARHRDAAVKFGRYGFFVRYRVEGADLVVVRVFHGHQNRQRQP